MKLLINQLCFTLKRFTTFYNTATSRIYEFILWQLCNDKDTCIKFWAHREFEVVHSLPVSIRAYDYDEPCITQIFAEQCVFCLVT